MRYVAYYRVSTQEQGRSGLGLDAQVQAVEQYARARGAEVVAHFTEIESGKVAERPQLAQAVSAAIRLRATLLIAKLDRLSRSVHFISTLMLQPGLEIEACDLPAANRMLLHIMASVAEGEAAAISARTKAALEQARQRGKKFGFAHENNIARAKECSRVASTIVHERSRRYADLHGPTIERMRQQGMTFQEIAKAFTERGVPFARKKRGMAQSVWTLQRIHQLYKQYRFIGPHPYGFIALPAPGHPGHLDQSQSTAVDHGNTEIGAPELIVLPRRRGRRIAAA